MVDQPPSVPGTISLRRRMFANVPRIITSWLPRRAPYELKSFFSTPCAISHLPAGLAAGMLPAGEMWSVVIESPSIASARAPVIGRMPGGCHRHALEVRRVLHVRRVRVPRVRLAGRHVERLPLLVALEDVGVLRA